MCIEDLINYHHLDLLGGYLRFFFLSAPCMNATLCSWGGSAAAIPADSGSNQTPFGFFPHQIHSQKIPSTIYPSTTTIPQRLCNKLSKTAY